MLSPSTKQKSFSHIPQKTNLKKKKKKHLKQLLETPYQLEPPINRLEGFEVQEVINSLNLRKSQRYDLITGQILE
jgi:hypothetical protein